MKLIKIGESLVSLENVLEVKPISYYESGRIRITYRDNNHYDTGYTLRKEEMKTIMEKIFEILTKTD